MQYIRILLLSAYKLFVAGKSWVELVKEYVLEPLEMAESYATFAEAAEAGDVLLRGYTSSDEGDFSPLAPDADKLVIFVSGGLIWFIIYN